MTNALDAINHICDKKNKVSSHFLIDKKGNIFSLVDEKYRAWHAGISKWNLINDINSNSIGIELDNSGHHLNFEKFTNKQIHSLIELLQYLKKKYNINSKHILGHSDIAPYRKIDPGQKFPWRKLIKLGILDKPNKILKKKINTIENEFINKSKNTIKLKALYMLFSIGYDTYEAEGSAKNLVKIIKVFQMRYLFAKKITGKIDSHTYRELLNIYNHYLTN